MPPKGSRVVKPVDLQDTNDSRSENSSTRPSHNGVGATAGTGGGRGGKRQAAATLSSLGANALRDAATAGDSSSNAAGGAGGGAQQAGMGNSNAFAWPQEPLSFLHAYRHTHRIPNAPSCFSNQRNQFLLTNPGIGRQSPTMCRKKGKRKVPKEQLALSMRKNFNAAAVSEVEVMVGLLYKVRNQDKAFRMRSTPSKPVKTNTTNGQ